MEIHAKRRTRYLGWGGPVEMKLNGEHLGEVQGKMTHTFSIPESYGTLSYHQSFDRSHKINVKDGDTVIIKETILNKLVNIVFITTMLSFILYGLNVLITGTYLETPIVRYGLIFLALSLIVISVVSFIFNSYKLVNEDHH